MISKARKDIVLKAVQIYTNLMNMDLHLISMKEEGYMVYATFSYYERDFNGKKMRWDIEYSMREMQMMRTTESVYSG